MSLLMEALKRAEQANQQGQANHQLPDGSSLALEPVPVPTTGQATGQASEQPPATSLPELPTLEALDDQFLAHVKQPALRNRSAVSSQPGPQKETASRLPQETGSGTVGTRPSQPETTAEREAILNAFAVKRPAVPGRSFFMSAGIATVVAVAAIGTYFWYQLRPPPGLALKSPVFAGMAQSAPSSPVAPAMTAAVAVSPDTAANTTPTRKKDPASPLPTPVRGEPSSAEPTTSAVEPGVEPIRFSKSRPKAESAADEGYDAFHKGNIAAARSAFGRLLERDPRNVNALHGLAAIALREGRINDAEAAYQRVLDIDPRDAIANAGLLGTRNNADPVASEARVKDLLAGQPEMHILHFALGNLYARQNRWSEAQQAYFSAYRGDGENPDYLFNLAASLDQLHQPRLARQYYEQALKAAESRPASFDHNQATTRLHDLQR